MKRLLLVGLALIGLNVPSAFGADIPVKAPPSTVVAYNWSGLYAGVHVGYGWADPNIGLSDGNSLSNRPQPNGVLGGGQIGAQWQAGNWVLGVEADASYGDLDETRTCTVLPAGVTLSCRGAPKYFGTIDGRLGYALNNWLIYAKGGVAWSHESFTQLFNSGVNCVGTPCTGGVYQWGWTVGGGVEYGLSRNWSVKVEYDFLDFDHRDTVTLSNGSTTDTFTLTKTIQKVEVGLNYRFGSF